MTITFTPSSTGVTLDETGALQFNGSAGNTVPSTDNDDKDVSLATLLAQQLNFHTRLFTDLALNPAFCTANGAAFGTIGTATSTTPITSITPAFTNGASSGLFATNGKELFLYGTALDSNIVLLREADGSGNPNPTGAIAAAIYLKVDIDGTQTSEDVSVWIVQFEALKSPNAAQPDEALTLANLSLTVGASLEFDFAGAPSGQNYFMLFGKQDAALLVSGKNPVDDTTNTSISTGDTVNTSKGGGETTLGVNNQMVDPGEGMHFRFVTLASTNFLVPNLDQNEADVEANTVANGFINTPGASLQFVQTQPGGGAGQYFTVKLTAYTADKSAAAETGTNFGEELENDTPVPILSSGVQVIRGGVNVVGTDPPGSAPPITASVVGGVLTVTGLKAGDELFYTTNGDHNHVFVEAVSGAAFDIGGFSILSAEEVPFAINNIKFDDDAPTAAGTLAGNEVTIDESAGLQTLSDGNQSTANEDDNDNDVLGTTAFLGSTLATVFGAVSSPGSDGSAFPQYALSSGAVVNSTGSSGGADGMKSTAFSLAINGGNGTDSLLDTTDGKGIFLYKEGDLIVGRYNADGNAGTGTSGNEAAAFAIAIDQAGRIATVQFASLDHPTTTNHDDVVDLTGKINALVTVTDNDDDTATSTPIAVGDKINFEDSGPTLTGVQNSTNSLIFAASTTETKSFTFTVGSDNEEPQGVALTDFTNPDNASDLAASNLDELETLMDVNITASQVGNTVTYYTPDGGDAGTDPDKLFELTVTDSDWTFTIFQDAPLVFNPFDFSTIPSGSPLETISLQALDSTTVGIFNGVLFGTIDAADGTESRFTYPPNSSDLPGTSGANINDDLNADANGFGVRGGAASNMNNNEGFSLSFFTAANGLTKKTVEGMQFKMDQQGNTDDVVLSFELIKFPTTVGSGNPATDHATYAANAGDGNDPDIVAIETGAGVNLITSKALAGDDDGSFWLRLGLPSGNNDVVFTILSDDFKDAYAPAANEIVVYVDGTYETAVFRTAYPDAGTFDQYPSQVNDSVRIHDIQLIETLPVPNVKLDFAVQGTDGDGDVTTTGVFNVFVSEDGFAF